MALMLLFQDAPSMSGASWLLAALILSFARPLLAAGLPTALSAGGMQLFEEVIGALGPDGSSPAPATGGILARAGALALSAALASILRRLGSGGERPSAAAEKEDAGAKEVRRSPSGSKKALPEAALADEYEDFIAAAHEELLSHNHPMLGADYESRELDHMLAGERTAAAAHEYENAMDDEYARYFDQMLAA